MSQEQSYLCSICFKPVDLNSCKIDENGRSVHENCYALKLLHSQLQLKKPVKKTAILGPWRRVV